jgi:hypothetical protein
MTSVVRIVLAMTAVLRAITVVAGTPGREPVRVDRSREGWLDFTVTPGGSARAVVPFKPQLGDRSIVIHQEPADQHGAAGARLSRLPLRRRQANPPLLSRS